ncbi:uncharacterized protein N7446_005577 [Penicillium canescens]|uniref:Uncharacterized protein n=1 Tax=Penicillium canescens TaxID=5083 RepID=A0AAD6II04_PENCN|nr:uncharacterized protein N7446_005577 [Penicillium canescens]KAJ6050949.1 hypothetical protein N7460_001483 [Penicillium canescens]KAJ6061457.1 hypothetical protein N7446_005577 [Penicillium canescens]
MAHVCTVTKGPYIPWSPEEEENLPKWVPRYQRQGLPWKEIEQEYVRQFKIPRSAHSIRGKLDQLQKGHRRQRPISKRAAKLHQIAARQTRQTRHRQQTIWAVLPASPPPLQLREPNPQARRILRQMRQLETARRHTSADSSTDEGGRQHLPLRVSKNPDPLAKNQSPSARNPASRPMSHKTFGRSIGISPEQMVAGGKSQSMGSLYHNTVADYGT